MGKSDALLTSMKSRRWRVTSLTGWGQNPMSAGLEHRRAGGVEYER